MAEMVPEKSRGLKFAEQQLLRHGWEHGKGLGRQENGISEAVKVKVKSGKGGVGHKQGEQFTFHWWDHVFNKASSSLQVQSDQSGVQVKKTVEEDDDGMISNKKPTKATLAKDKLYGCFVKSSTLLSGQEQPEPKCGDPDDSSSSSDDENDEDEHLDLSSTTKLSDADLMKACGGLTAHKGARHGLTMSAKLARLEQQEVEFMAKYGKKNQSASSSPVCVTPATQSAAQSPQRPEEMVEASHSKKRKRKKSAVEFNVEAVSESPEMDTRPKKKKKRKDHSNERSQEITVPLPTEDELITIETGVGDHSQRTTKRKHKKRKQNAEENGELSETIPPTDEGKRPEGAAEGSSETDTDPKTKKKKRSKRHREHANPAEVEESHDAESTQSEPVQDCVPEMKEDLVIMEEAEVGEEESPVKRRRKKCKKDNGNLNKEALPPKKKKKSTK